jgi:predicted small secreted protein
MRRNVFEIAVLRALPIALVMVAIIVAACNGSGGGSSY